MIDALLSTALLGTRGVPPKLTDIPGDVAEILAAVPEADAETQLLDAAGVLTLYARAGARPQRGKSTPLPVPPDERPVCTPRAAALLATVLDSGARDHLAEWLELAAARGNRPPAHQLPKLLDLAAARRELRLAVEGVIDRRGRWMRQFNPRWQTSAEPAEAPENAWQVGTKAQRAELLRTLRATAPARVRELVQSTWSVDAADERAEWVVQLAAGLSGDDEPFLESCLDDRSSKVREAAAKLLARLPQSRFVERMIERAAPLLTFTPATSGSTLKQTRGTKGGFVVTLPESFDKSMQRDGLSEKPPPKLGPKQWLLLQIVACVPLAYWTRTTGATAAQLIEALPEDFTELLLSAWMRALAHGPEPLWIEPLATAARAELPLTADVLRVVPAPLRAELLSTLSGKSPGVVAPSEVLEAWQPLAEDVSRQVIESWDLDVILYSDAVFSLHPATLGLLESRLLEFTGSPSHKRKVDEALSAVAMRRALHQEFAP
jgi:hypothetical protein